MMMNNGTERPPRRTRRSREHAPMSWNYRNKMEGLQQGHATSAPIASILGANDEGVGSLPKVGRRMDLAEATARFCTSSPETCQQEGRLTVSESCNHYGEQEQSSVLVANRKLTSPSSQVERRGKLNNEPNAFAALRPRQQHQADGPEANERDRNGSLSREKKMGVAAAAATSGSSSPPQAQRRCSIIATSFSKPPEDKNGGREDDACNTKRVEIRGRSRRRRGRRKILKTVTSKLSINHCQSSIFGAPTLVRVCLLLAISCGLISAQGE